MPPELSRPFPLDRLGESAQICVTAEPPELLALAVRMGIPEIKRLSCEFDLHRAGGSIIAASGRLRARVVQTCVVSLDLFETDLEDDFTVRFVPAGTESDELDLEADDEIPYEDGLLDLGEATAEQLALALDPFPRKPGASLPEDTESEAHGGAFAALRNLQRRG